MGGGRTGHLKERIRNRKDFCEIRASPVTAGLEQKPPSFPIMISKGIMDTSLERIRAKIAELEAKLADLRIAERELLALETGAEDTNCAGAKNKTQAAAKRPGGGAPNHRRRDCRHPRPAWRPFVSRDRRSYQGDRPRHQQSSRILYASSIEKARLRQKCGRQVGAAESPLSANSHMM